MPNSRYHFKKLFSASILLACLNAPTLAADRNIENWKHYSQAIKQEKLGNQLQAVKQYTKALKEKPRDVATLTKLGMMYLRSDADGDLREESMKTAISYLNKANSIQKDDALISMLLGKAYQEVNDYDNAIKHYEKAITLEPDNVLLRTNLALIHFENKSFKEAIELYNKIVISYPDNLKARSYLGAALQATDNYLAAIEQYNYVLNYEKDSFSILKNLADSWLALEQYDKARETYLKAQEVDPNVPDIYADLAFIEHEQKNFPEAIENYKKALELKDNARWKRSLAYALWSNKDLTEAVDKFTDIEEYNIAGYIHQVLGDNDKAIESYEKAVAKNPKDTKSLFNLARLYQNTDNIELAKNQYLKVLEQKPNDLETIFLLGVLEHESGEINKAIEHYNDLIANHLKDNNKAVEQLGSSKDIKNKVHYNLGLAYKSKNDLNKAEENFEEVLKEGGFSQADNVYKELSFIKIALDKNSEAEGVIKGWLREDPTSVDARNIYADFLIHLSKERQAIEQLRLASVLDKTTETRLKLANLLHNQNNLYEALAEYQTILQKEPENLNALLGTANNFKKLGLMDEALNTHKEAVDKYPEDLLVNYNYGLLLQENEQIKEALTHYEKVAQINPEFTPNYYVLGLCYWDLNQKEKAIESWNQFLTNSSDENLKQEVVKLMQEGNNPQTAAPEIQQTEPESPAAEEETNNELVNYYLHG